MTSTLELTAGYEKHVYAVVTPIMGAYAFVGEVDKYVTASSTRFSKLSSTASGFTVSALGVAGETVKVCAVKVADLSLECSSITFDTMGSKTVTFPTTN
jgi:hypothetical protein